MRSLARLGLMAMLALTGCGQSSVPDPRAQAGWTAAWAAAPSDAYALTLPAGSALRQFITPLADGTHLRLRLSNRLGTQAIALAQVTVGRADRGAALQPGSMRVLRFGGADAVTLAPGASVISDALNFPLQAFERLGITLMLAEPVQQLPRHYQALEIPYLALGSVSVSVADTSGAAFLPLAPEQLASWYLIAALEVQGGSAAQTVVALGDSITDGYVPALPCAGVLTDPATVGANLRYPDLLARRLQQAGRKDLSVVNVGISGNRINADGFSAQHGPSLISRLDADVLSLPNVRSVILLGGINDLGLQTAPDAQALINGLDAATHRLQAAGLRVVLGTITPARGFCAGPLAALDPLTPGILSGSAAVDTARRAVNDWIRARSSADAVADFDACLRDPANPSYLAADYDSGDHLHPNTAGYAALAACVPLASL